MKKQRKNSNRRSRRSQAAAPPNETAGPNAARRRFLKLARNAAIGAALLGGTGYVFAQNVLTAMHEHDLERIGNGRATVVQIHDPQCSLCLALQRETRAAFKMMDGADLDYVVANIRSEKGRSFANSHGVQHVTLLLFDDTGKLRDVLQGQHGSYQLKSAFEDLLKG